MAGGQWSLSPAGRAPPITPSAVAGCCWRWREKAAQDLSQRQRTSFSVHFASSHLGDGPASLCCGMDGFSAAIAGPRSRSMAVGIDGAVPIWGGLRVTWRAAAAAIAMVPTGTTTAKCRENEGSDGKGKGVNEGCEVEMEGKRAGRWAVGPFKSRLGSGAKSL